MAKDSVADWSTTDTLNTDVGGTNIAEGCAPSGINDAIRKMMAQIATWAGSLLTSSQAASTYLPLAGGTLTGGITGTTATFSGALTGGAITGASGTFSGAITAASYNGYTPANKAGDTFTGDIHRDANFFFAITETGNPVINLDAGDWIEFQRATNTLVLFIGNVAAFSIDGSYNLNSRGNITANITL